MRRCPVCRVQFTPLLIADESIIDYCKRCRGIWFDGTELKSLRRDDPVMRTLLKTVPLHPAPFRCLRCGASNPRTIEVCHACAEPLRLACPNCNLFLKKTLAGKLTADRCEGCRGVWLDGGELQDLFREFYRLQRVRPGSTVTAAAADLTLDTLIWAPDLVFETAWGAGRLASAGLEGATQLPEIAGAAADASLQLASGATEAAMGAADVLSDVFSTFIELLLGIFD